MDGIASILIVDDNPKYLKDALPMYGYDVTVAEDGIEALKILYDDNVLKMNNVVDMPGTSIIAKMFGFVKWPYFRNA